MFVNAFLFYVAASWVRKRSRRLKVAIFRQTTSSVRRKWLSVLKLSILTQIPKNEGFLAPRGIFSEENFPKMLTFRRGRFPHPPATTDVVTTTLLSREARCRSVPRQTRQSARPYINLHYIFITFVCPGFRRMWPQGRDVVNLFGDPIRKYKADT